MTTMNFADQPEETRTPTTSVSVPTTSPTWRDLSGHWLRSPIDGKSDTETLARRQAALQRWRGLIPDTGARL